MITTCHSEVGDFGQHDYKGLPECIRCHVPRDGKAGKPNGGGIASESIAQIKQEEITGQPAGETKKAAKAAAKETAKVESEKEIQQHREAVAEFVVEGKQEAQEFIARTLYGYEGNAFQPTADEAIRLRGAWAKLAKAMNWQFDSTWMAIGMVVFLEGKMTLRQWAQMNAEMAAAQKQPGGVQ